MDGLSGLDKSVFDSFFPAEDVELLLSRLWRCLGKEPRAFVGLTDLSDLSFCERDLVLAPKAGATTDFFGLEK